MFLNNYVALFLLAISSFSPEEIPARRRSDHGPSTATRSADLLKQLREARATRQSLIKSIKTDLHDVEVNLLDRPRSSSEDSEDGENSSPTLKIVDVSSEKNEKTAPEEVRLFEEHCRALDAHSTLQCQSPELKRCLSPHPAPPPSTPTNAPTSPESPVRVNDLKHFDLCGAEDFTLVPQTTDISEVSGRLSGTRMCAVRTVGTATANPAIVDKKTILKSLDPIRLGELHESLRIDSADPPAIYTTFMGNEQTKRGTAPRTDNQTGQLRGRIGQARVTKATAKAGSGSVWEANVKEHELAQARNAKSRRDGVIVEEISPEMAEIAETAAANRSSGRKASVLELQRRALVSAELEKLEETSEEKRRERLRMLKNLKARRSKQALVAEKLRREQEQKKLLAEQEQAERLAAEEINTAAAEAISTAAGVADSEFSTNSAGSLSTIAEDSAEAPAEGKMLQEKVDGRNLDCLALKAISKVSNQAADAVEAGIADASTTEALCDLVSTSRTDNESLNESGEALPYHVRVGISLPLCRNGVAIRRDQDYYKRVEDESSKFWNAHKAPIFGPTLAEQKAERMNQEAAGVHVF